MNAFFYYRQHVRDEIEKTCAVSNSNEISKIAAERWRNESDKVQQIYRNMSKDAYDAFKLKHPDYIWNQKRKILPKPTPQIDLDSSSSHTLSPVYKTNKPLNDAVLHGSTRNSPVGSSLNTQFDLLKVPTSIQDNCYIPLECSITPSIYFDFEELVDSFISEFNPYYSGHVTIQQYQYNI
ncbi:hypothetical protein HDV04_003448 [Boothiomyces sp. JEL0838]|nr:hypothetical protein HDV04_003448 [Boothiomyces sp. JEL0838]